MPEVVLSDGLYRLVLVCALCVCGPCPGLRPPERGTAPRFPNRARARFPCSPIRSAGVAMEIMPVIEE